jgi:hypothetical protein
MRPSAERIRLLVLRKRKYEREPAMTASAKLKARRKVGIKAKAYQKRIELPHLETHFTVFGDLAHIASLCDFARFP